MSKIVTFGEIMLRLAPNGYDRFFQNNQMQASFGGAEANVAVSLANFGIDVSFVTKLPDNPIGQAAINELRYFGVDPSNIARGGERLGIYYQEKGAGVRGGQCIYDRKYSSFQQASFADFNWDEIFEGVEWFHFTGITPALGGDLPQICKEACINAKEKGIKISCDLNFRSKLWKKEVAQKTMAELCSYVDVCIANEEDAKAYFDIESEGSDFQSGNLNIFGYHDVAKQLMERFRFKMVAITLRQSFSASDNDWAALLYDGKDYYLSPIHHLRIVDRIGGGDSFAAGLIFGLLKEYPLQKSLDFAVAASALKHTIEGDFNRVTIEEIRKLLQGNVSGRIQR